MKITESEIRQRQHSRPGQRRIAATGTFVLLSMLAGCEGLLDVNVPGRVREDDLNDPRLAATLVIGVQGDFECTFLAYIMATGLWTTDFMTTSATRTQHQIGVRAATTITFTPGDCTSTNPHSVWLPVNTARIQGENAVKFIE